MINTTMFTLVFATFLSLTGIPFAQEEVPMYPVFNDVVILDRENNQITVKPWTDFNGQLKFQYVIQDDKGETSTAYVIINVTEVNDPPVAVSDTFSTPEETSLIIDIDYLMVNDYDPDGDVLIFGSGSEEVDDLGPLFVNEDEEVTPDL